MAVQAGLCRTCSETTLLVALLSIYFQSSVGGRITVMQTNLPTVGPGALQNREDATQQAAKVSGKLSFSRIEKCRIPSIKYQFQLANLVYLLKSSSKVGWHMLLSWI